MSRTFTALLISQLIEENECESNPCVNGGVCNDEVNWFRCDCPNGLAQPNCETGNECSYV